MTVPHEDGDIEARLRRLAKRAGLGPPVRAARRAVRRVRPLTWSERRARDDDEGMRLLLCFLLAEDSRCVDVGAGIGDVLELMVRYAPRGRHIAFEPIPVQHAVVARRFPGVDVRNAAASDRRGEATFTNVLNFPAYSGFRRRDYPGEPQIETITVHTERLDDVLDGSPPPALIKIDVEGAEGLVLRGALETLRAHRPVVVFEHGRSAAEYGTTSDEVFDILCDGAGLRIFDLAGAGPYGRADLAATQVWNFVAHR